MCHKTQYHKETKMKDSGSIFFVLLISLLIILLGPFVTVLLWGWVVPDVFTGAVKQNILPAHLSWGEAFKLNILIFILFGATRS